jgi:hypothetical protein
MDEQEDASNAIARNAAGNALNDVEVRFMIMFV